MPLPFSTLRGASNIALYSHQIDQWGANAVTFAANASGRYDRILETVANDYHVASKSSGFTCTVGRTYTYYARLRDETRRYAVLRIGDGVSGYSATFDLVAGLIYSETNCYGYMRALNDGLGTYECWITFNPTTAGVLTHQIALSDTTGVYHSYVGDVSKTILAGYVSLVEGDDPGVETETGATAINPTSTANVRRVNIAKFSEDFSNAVWVNGLGAGMTFTVGQADPLGGTTAQKCDFTAAGVFNQLTPATPALGIRLGEKFTLGMWLYSPSKATIALRIYDNAGASVATSLITLTASWKVYSVTFTAVAGSLAVAGAGRLLFGLDNRGGIGDGVAGTVYAWRGQVVRAGHLGDYVKTTAYQINPTRGIR